MTFINVDVRANSDEVAICIEDELNLTAEEWNSLDMTEQAELLDKYLDESEGGGVYAYHWDREVMV